MNADGSGVRHVSDALHNAGHLTWSLDGSKLAFSNNNEDIWVMKANSSGQTIITEDSSFYHHTLPTWSPDGSKIAFTGLPKDEGYYGDIYVMDADGSNITSLTHDRDIPDGHPEWSPDGTRIMFERSVPNGGPPWWENTDIYVMNPDGSNVIRLTRYPGSDSLPEWSPDGSEITFMRSRFVDGHIHTDVYVMNADGSNKVKVSPDNPGAHDDYSDPTWSPDGSKIAFTSHREGDVDQFGDRAREIYTVNADGSNPTNISNNPADDFGPDWQPLTGPTSKADCKKGGYKEFGFNNQGQCIASLQKVAETKGQG
jgi:Tol biopolymer transport system component